MNDCIVFLQRRTGKSGAPTALWRLLRHPEIAKLNPVLVVSQQGWLTHACEALNIPYIIEPFPSSRSLSNLFWGNRRFIKKISTQLAQRNFRPRLVVGNDHLEGILTNETGKQFNTRTVLFLRSSGTTRKNYYKYQCHRAAQCYAVGERLSQKISSWDSHANVKTLYDGFYESDFSPPKPIAPEFPRKILVAGNASPGKGWSDLIQAIEEFEKNPEFPALEWDFTAEISQCAWMHPEKLKRCKFNFIERTKDFSELVHAYDLVIHPSRAETFGLAMMETLAAGIPLFCSRTGVIEQIQKNDAFLFEPGNVSDLARKLEFLWTQWTKIDFNLEQCQRLIREHFMMEKIAPGLARDFLNLM
ncbi:MAG: glycosyltransferase family 4 protein [Verrucomicrobiota bacterium]